MRNILLAFLISFFSFASLFASSIPDNAVYSSDGTHWFATSMVNDKTVLTMDGVERARYSSLIPSYEWNTLYTVASNTDTPTKTYLLKDGNIVDSASALTLVTHYSSTIQKIVGYTVYDAWVFQLKKLDGTIVFTDNNAGASSFANVDNSGIIQSTVYDKNNNYTTYYFNEKKIPGKSISWIGTLKKGKASEFLFSSLNDENTTSLILYNTKSQTFRKLPSYDGVGTYGYTSTAQGNIKAFQYAVMIWEKFAIADISGKIISSDRYDEVSSITSYGDKFYKVMKKDGQNYFSYGNIMYGPYDQMDTSFNVLYGFNPSNYNSVKLWSIFVQKNGKNSIIVNGKEVAL